MQEPYMIADEPTRPPRAVPRMTSRNLTHSEYYWHFARPGMPVVVAGMCDGPEWVERGRKVLECCGQRPESRMCGSMKCDDIKDAHKSNQANFCSNECAALAHPGHMDWVPQIFRFPHPLPSLSHIFNDPRWRRWCHLWFTWALRQWLLRQHLNTAPRTQALDVVGAVGRGLAR